ncbi:ACP S-malonyltransferase [Planctobacterium marinum]|uniref:Malonyl CoA-acyl carrier protein transacylase n=1 Tax=Planctobacterium marinum TaxID=1631968 RepID=A0AA48KS02_9ALTE|nr:malonyl CoA-acyl carrier protein transacylase [Planctobacterium marinum]
MTKAFVFPGQGSQTLGMLNELEAVSDVVKQTFQEASDALGYDLWKLIAEGPVENLNQTDKTQPALLASSVAIWRHYLAEGGAKPSVMAGHSLGEYSALTCTGVLQFSDALKLVKARGEFMQEAVPAGTGAMFAIIGLDDAKIVEICAEQANDQVVSAVNFNSPGQVVIAGHAEAVARAGEACKAAGAKRALPLPVSVPSHCALMQPAAERLATQLDALVLSEPEIAVINNVDVQAENSAEAIKSALVRQLYSPVRWTETVQKMAADGVTQLVECGPGKVLTGLTKRIDKSLSGSAMNTPETVTDLL